MKRFARISDAELKNSWRMEGDLTPKERTDLKTCLEEKKLSESKEKEGSPLRSSGMSAQKSNSELGTKVAL